MLQQYPLENIFNADETGFFFRLGPNKTLASKNDTAKGYKKDKQRLTILLACNATGSRKLKLFVIGKSKRPRCLKNVNLETLPARYSSNTKAWMTGEMWKDWLKWFDLQCKEQTLLLADNCPAHVDSTKLHLRYVTVHYLPPNTTSHIQPCDAGIIFSFKAHYQKLLVSKWVKQIDTDGTIAALNLKEAINLISEAWDCVHQQTIYNCWTKTGILPRITESQVSNDLIILDETIIQTVLIEEGIQNEITESGDDDDDEIPIISHKKGKEAFNTFKQYFEQLIVQLQKIFCFLIN